MIKNANILITGASSGLGRALALYYAQNGAATIFICGRDVARLTEVQNECQKYSTSVYSWLVDVTDADAVKSWIEQCNDTTPLNLIIANAGVATTQETSANIYNTFNTNVNGVINTVLPAIEIFRQRNDKKSHQQIAIISSMAGYHGLPSCPSYSASKACVKAWGEALRGSLKPERIKVNVICPGFVRSRITDQNTCPMPGFMEAETAAAIIARKLDQNVGLISFPTSIRLAAWFISTLPNCVSEFIYNRLPHKV